MEDRALPSQVPVLLIPGEVGSWPAGVNSSNPEVVAAAVDEFAHRLGLPPADLTANIHTASFESEYADLISALEDDGYTLGVNLFVVAQDWRLPVAPLDGVDNGVLSGLTAKLMTSNGPDKYSVQYLGYWLKQAQSEWAETHGGAALPYVNVIAHSEGYLIARAYISSPAYGGAYRNAAGGVERLPRIGAFIDLAGPNQGSPTVVNDLHNNFYIPNALGFNQVRFDLFQLSYYDTATLGQSIEGPNGKPLITPRSIRNPETGKPDPIRFLRQYFKAGLDLTPTYPAVDHQTLSADSPFANGLLNDINAGPYPDAFLRRIGHMTAIFGDNQTTTTGLSAHRGTGGVTIPLTTTLAGFRSQQVPTKAGEPWFKNVVKPASGDGQGPTVSFITPFRHDPRVTLLPQPGVNHVTVLTDPSVQATIDAILAQPAPPPG